ncbi:MAG: glutaredoxin family protein [Dehalococcoidia bacterium]|nr:glutaredoxin family protein [Dehalococcoidia bacterium]
MTVEHVQGREAGQVMLFALSTCVWCKKTRSLLDELGVAYDCQYVDLLQGNARTKAISAVRQSNPRSSFPTLIVNKRVIIGFQETEIREALAA